MSDFLCYDFKFKTLCSADDVAHSSLTQPTSGHEMIVVEAE